MTVALDFGTTQLRSLRVEDKMLKARSIPAIYAEGAFEESFARALDRLQRGYVQIGSRVLLIGENAATFAPFIGGNVGRLFQPTTDPWEEVLQERAIKIALGKILPPPGRDDICVMTYSQGDGLNDEGRHQLDRLCQWIRELGYAPLIVPSALGIVLAAGSHNGYSAIGLSFGAGSIELSVVRQAREIGRLALPWGGDWIDEHSRMTVAETVHEIPDLDALRAWKESAGRDQEPSRLDFALPIELAYRTALDRTFRDAAVSFGQLTKSLPEPVDLLCAGRSCLWKNFLPLVSEMLDRHRFPLNVREVKLVSQPETAVLRGLLIHAELERVCQTKAA